MGIRKKLEPAETLRIRGELRCEQRDPEGMVDLHAALEKARGQQASAFELRAAMSLARAVQYALQEAP